MRTGVCTTGVRGSLVQIQSSRPINTGSDCQFFSHHDSHLIFRCQIIQLLEDINVNILRDRLEPVSSFGEPVAYSAPRKLAAGGVIEKGATVVCTLTGHGLKDPETAIESSAQPRRIKPDIGAALDAMGLEEGR